MNQEYFKDLYIYNKGTLRGQFVSIKENTSDFIRIFNHL